MAKKLFYVKKQEENLSFTKNMYLYAPKTEK